MATTLQAGAARADNRMTSGTSVAKRRITVLCGGPSRERAVSLESGRAISEALKSLGHIVYTDDIAPDDLSALDRDCDVFFVALHGSFGEDGTLQAILESRGLAFTGSDSQSCRLAMDKDLTKKHLTPFGIPTARWIVVDESDIQSNIQTWTLPVVVKPVDEGSTIACHVVRDVIELRPVVADVVREYGRAMIEEFVPGVELTVGVLNDQALPAIEIRVRGGFYDYHAKYQSDETQYLFDTAVPSELLEEIGRMSVEVHQRVGCRDCTRVDWRINPDGWRPYLLELNTSPGMTSHSLIPMAARRAGMEMPQFCHQLVEGAIARHGVTRM